jgi:hypothetical protein
MMLTSLLFSPSSSLVDFVVFSFVGVSAFFLSAMSFRRLSWIGSDTISGGQSFIRFLMTLSRASTPFGSDFLSMPVKFRFLNGPRHRSAGFKPRCLHCVAPEPRRVHADQTTRDTPSTSWAFIARATAS